MREIALKMLWGDRAKYLGLVFGITFATLLMSQQVSIFIGLMARTASQIIDVREADLWIMDARVQYIDEFKPLPDKQLQRVRGVSGVEWAVPWYKGVGVVRAPGGVMQQVIGTPPTRLTWIKGCFWPASAPRRQTGRTAPAAPLVSKFFTAPARVGSGQRPLRPTPSRGPNRRPFCDATDRGRVVRIRGKGRSCELYFANVGADGVTARVTTAWWPP